jgi:hypothetical protein
MGALITRSNAVLALEHLLRGSELHIEGLRVQLELGQLRIRKMEHTDGYIGATVVLAEWLTLSRFLDWAERQPTSVVATWTAVQAHKSQSPVR